MRINEEKSDELWKSAKLAIGERAEYLKYLITEGKRRFDGDVLDLIDELVDMEDIPEELVRKIGAVLGERWMRKNEQEQDNK